MNDDLVELVARAICCPDGCRYLGDGNGIWDQPCYCDTAEFRGSGIEKKTRAAIAAMREPSEAQIIAGAEWACGEDRALGCWQAMIDCALSEQRVGEHGQQD